MANPLVRQLGLQQVLQRDQALPSPGPEDMELQYIPALAGHIRAAWGENKLQKEAIDIKLLSNLRARRGVYSAAQLQVLSAGGGQNIVWADLTNTKSRAGSAWIREIVMPTGARPWGVVHTPVPELPSSIKKGVVAKAIQQAQQTMVQISQAGGETLTPGEFRDMVSELGDKLRTDAEKQMEKIATIRARRMERVIADRLDQGGWDHAMDEFVEDFVTFPAAVLKGPIYRRSKRLSWGAGWKPKVIDGPVQTWERVSPFDIYPAIGAKDCQQGNFIERQRFFRPELFALKGLPDFRDDEIEKALLDYTNGHLEGWLWTEAERNRLEQESMYLWTSPPGVIDALNFWGSVPGWKLIGWGIRGWEELERDKDYEVNAVLIGKYVIYAVINPHPLGMRPYRKASYETIPGAFWGRSVPDLCETSQKMCNAIARSLADNLGAASGPMMWVYSDRLADGEQTMEIVPWKIFQLKSDPNSSQTNPGIGFFQADDRSGPLMATYEQWEMRADDATGIPRYTYGNQDVHGAADTASGLSMLMNNAAKGLRRAISGIDMDVIGPSIEETFVNEMLYNPDESIKGDCVVVPRGAAAILIKETAQQRRMQFLGLTAENQLLAQVVGAKGVAALARELAEAMELPVDDIVPDDDELAKRQQQEAEAMQKQQAAELEMQGKLKQQEIEMQTQADAQRDEQQAQTQSKAQQQDFIMQMVREAVQAEMKRVNGESAPKSSKSDAK
jgi:hypothetical protein